MPKLLITKCNDSLMWYSKLVGQTVPYEGEWSDAPDVYKSREPAGYINIVKKTDAVIVEN